MSADEALARVWRAWNEPGRFPDLHRQAQRTLHRTWPMLARALEALPKPEGLR